jgi:hypothetical protein
MTSTDTVNWTSQRSPADISWNGITYGQGIFVGVGFSGTSRVMTANFPNIYKNNSAAIGNGALTTGNNSMAVGVGSAALGDNSVAYGVGTSVTGNNSVAIGTSAKVISPFHLGDWKAYTACSVNRVVGVTYGNGLFVAVLFWGTSPGKVITSPDGINWTFRQAVGAINWHQVVYGIPSIGTYAGQGLFVALSWGGTPGLMTSPDGINWTVRSNGTINGKFFLRMEYGNGTFVGIASDNSASTSFVYSTDGINWATSTGSPTAQNYWSATAYGNGYFVAASLISSGTRSYRSPDGITWSPVTLPIDGNWIAMAFGNGVFVALSSNSSVCMVSPDGLNWTVYSTPVAQLWNGMAFGNGLFVAVSATTSANVSIVSPDGINWTIKHTPYDYTWRCIAYGTVNGVGTFVSFTEIDLQTPNVMVASFEETQNSIAIGQSATVNGSGSIAIGANAKVSGQQLTNFIIRASPADNNWYGITSGVPSSGPYQGQTLFVSVATSGTGYRAMTSTDCINWTLRPTPADNGWREVTFGIPYQGIYAGQGLFVAVADAGTNRIMTSLDGINWTARAAPIDTNAWVRIVYGNGTFVSVSYTITTNPIMYSRDGVTWSSGSTAGITGAQWSGLTFGNGLFVSTAFTGTAGKRVMTSLNGITWTLRTTPVDNPWLGVTYGVPSTGQYDGVGLFVAVSSTGSLNRVMTSVDATTWLIRTTPYDISNNTFLSITYGNGYFVTTAETTTTAPYRSVMISTDGIYWTTRNVSANNNWYNVYYGIPSTGPYAGQGVFISVAWSGTGNRIMTANFVDTNVSTSVAIGNGAVATDNNQIVLGTMNESVLAPGYFKLNSSPSIRGVYMGFYTESVASGTGTVMFGFSFPTPPYVVATMATVTSTDPATTNQRVYSISVSNITNESFDFARYYVTLPSGATGGATFLPFTWIAVCV